VLGDSVFVVDVDGRMAPSPEEYAAGLIEYLQQPDYELFHGRYVTTRALEKKFYPPFLKATGREHIPWRTVSAALGKVTTKRPKEFRVRHGRKWKRISVDQFLVPAPQKEKTPAE
jgi:hypothetical protein